MLNDIANRFNRSLETIRKMSDNLGLTILKKEVSVASVDSNLNAPLNPFFNHCLEILTLILIGNHF